MSENTLEKNLNDLLVKFDFKGEQETKLIIFMGLLGDFDSIEYAKNISKFLSSKTNERSIDVFILAIGNFRGKKKFCEFTGFPEDNLQVVQHNQFHSLIGASKGLDIGLGGWINLILMLAGIGSPKTLKEVFRGYKGDKGSNQIYSDKDIIHLNNSLNFSGRLFKESFGDGYLRPFELATYRLINMIEIIKHWSDYMCNSKYLPQRVATFLLDKNNEIIYKFISRDILNYSNKMTDPLHFLNKHIKK